MVYFDNDALLKNNLVIIKKYIYQEFRINDGINNGNNYHEYNKQDPKNWLKYRKYFRNISIMYSFWMINYVCKIGAS